MAGYNNRYTDRKSQRSGSRFGGGNRSGGSRFGGRDSGSREMFDAVCDNCGKDCKVPFRPNGSKPIYCSNCFEEREGGDQRSHDRGRSRSNGRDFDKKQRSRENEIIEKLDKILALLATEPKKPPKKAPKKAS